ncbi:MAG: 4-hydroxy-tetrahydrodipicolinate synthase [Candidatus Rifleibacteriota bacterium]
MNTDFLKGSWVALVTPFNEKLEIDYGALERLLDLHKSAKTDGLLICGTTGEAVTLSLQEKIELMSFVKKYTGGNIPIMFGTGSNDTRSSIDLTAKAASMGADSVLVVTPYYNKPPQKGLLEHFTAVAAATELPVVLYNVPGRTGTNMLAGTSLELAKISNIKAIKEASGNLDQIMELIRKAPPGFTVFSGDDALNLPIMACGGAGCISVTANIAPAMMKKFSDLALAGNIREAAKVHFKLLDLHRNLFCEANPLPAKAALKVKGLMEDYVRLPLCRPSADTVELMKTTIDGLE